MMFVFGVGVGVGVGIQVQVQVQVQVQGQEYSLYGQKFYFLDTYVAYFKGK
jgi:hypothetical protein